VRAGTACHPRRRIRAANSRHDPFFISWDEFQKAAEQKQVSIVSLTEGETESAQPEIHGPQFESLTLSVRWPVARPNRRSPKRCGASFSTSCTAGCARITPSTSFVTTTASASGLKRFWGEFGFAKAGHGGAGEAEKSRPADAPFCISAGSPAASFAMRSGWSVVTDAEIFGRYKISTARAAKNPRTHWRRVPRSTLISPIWKRAIMSFICSMASAGISV